MDADFFQKKYNSLSEKEKAKFKDFKDKFDALSDIEKKNFFGPLLFYINQKAKEKMLSDLPLDDRSALFTTIMVISSVSERLIKKVENESEFKKIYKEFQESKKVEKIKDCLKEKFEINIDKAVDELNRRKCLLKRSLLGNQFDNYLRIKKGKHNDKDVICNKIFEGRKKLKTNNNLVEKLESIEKEIPILKRKVYFALTDDILKVSVKDTDMLRYYAFLVYQPQQILFSTTLLDDKWEEFPLKWYSYHSSVPEIKTLFDMFKDGEDLSSYFVSKFDEDGFEELKKIMESPTLNPPAIHIFCGIKDKIEEAISCYRSDLFASTIYTALPIIEGILWRFAEYLSRSGVRIFAKQHDKISLIRKDDDSEIKEPTIGSLLKLTRFGNYFDLYFIEYFCSELYNERNPVLHGKDVDFNSKINAAKKIGTIEYIATTIKDYIEKNILKSYGEHMPKEIIDKLIDKKRNKKKA